MTAEKRWQRIEKDLQELRKKNAEHEARIDRAERMLINLVILSEELTKAIKRKLN
jgi:hypothetical protein